MDGAAITVRGLKIGLIEDEPDLTVLLKYNFESQGYEVETMSRGDEAEDALREGHFDLLVLDWMLPGLSGIELLRRLRRSPTTKSIPIIVLTARTTESDLIRAFETGADDFLAKPFSVRELMARAEALLRRRAPLKVAQTLSHGDIALDRSDHSLRINGKLVVVSPTDRHLLEYFLSNPQRVITRQQILGAVWGRDVCIDERTIDVNIGRLRRALAEAGAPVPISTVRGVGYRLDPV